MVHFLNKGGKLNIFKFLGFGAVKEKPEKPKTPFIYEKPQPDPKREAIRALIWNELSANRRGHYLVDCEITQFFTGMLYHVNGRMENAAYEDVVIALSELISKGKIIVKSVCFLRVNTVYIPTLEEEQKRESP